MHNSHCILTESCCAATRAREFSGNVRTMPQMALCGRRRKLAGVSQLSRYLPGVLTLVQFTTASRCSVSYWISCVMSSLDTR